MNKDDITAFFVVALAVIMGTLAKRAKQLEAMFSREEPLKKSAFIRILLIEGMTVPTIAILTFSAVASYGFNIYLSLAIGCLAGFGGFTTVNMAWEIFRDVVRRIAGSDSNIGGDDGQR